MANFEKLFQHKVAGWQSKMLATHACTRAAVSLIFRLNKRVVESPLPVDILFMQRAYNDADPWSGQISFPGGRFEQYDVSMQATAERETHEEMGFRLQASDYVGQIDDILAPIIHDQKTVHISSFVYLLDDHPVVIPNHEVEQVIWMPLADLLDPSRKIQFDHPSVAGMTMQGIRLDALSHDGVPLVLWGLSLHLMQHLFEILEL